MVASIINTPPLARYETWLSELQLRARERELEWMVCSTHGAHRAAYDSGLSPDEELSALADMAEWRGCGCGGGG